MNLEFYFLAANTDVTFYQDAAYDQLSHLIVRLFHLRKCRKAEKTENKGQRTELISDVRLLRGASKVLLCCDAFWVRKSHFQYDLNPFYVSFRIVKV